jgi:predicted DNA-binding WGR domain protein
MIRLECTRGKSNKYYELHLKEEKGRVTVTGYYGAIGQAPKEHPVYSGDSRTDAEQELEKKKQEKLKKGYTVVGVDKPMEKKTVNCR